jgi:hypothetical protein
MTDWRPISTSPREPYKKLDLWVVPGRDYNQKHRAKPHRVADAYASGNGRYWLDAKGCFIEGRRFYDEDDEWEQCFDPDDRGLDATIVTHWQPIPEEPE